MDDKNESVAFNDLGTASPEEASDRLEYADQLRELASDIIAGRAKTVVIFKYMHDDPHTLETVGFFEGEGAQKHMLRDMADYCQGELAEGTPIFLIGGEDDEA